MTTLAVFQGTAVDGSGDFIAAASIRVLDADTNSVVTLKPNRDGTGSKTNPFNAGSDGFFQFYVPEGRYNVEITSGGDTLVWSNIVLWADAVPPQSYAPVASSSASNVDADPADAGMYLRFSHASPTYTFDDGAGFVVGQEFHGRYVGSGSLMITQGGGMTVNPPFGGTLEIPEGGTFTVKIVAADEADLFGITVPA